MEKIGLIIGWTGTIVGAIVGIVSIINGVSAIKERIKKKRKEERINDTYSRAESEINIDKSHQIKKNTHLKQKPLFFIYELFLNGLSTDENHYLLKGCLVSKDDVDFKSMNFELPPSGKWEGDSKYYICKKIQNKWTQDENGNLLIKETRGTENNTLKGESDGLRIGKYYSYAIEGNYVVVKKDSPNAYKSLKDDTYKSLNISLSGVGDKNEKIENVKIIKCPNIRKSWLIFYFLFSLFVLSFGILSVIVSINNSWEYILNADSMMKSVIIILGVLILSAIVLFIRMIIQCVSQYIVLIKMEKFGIPRKTKTVSDTLLVPKIFEYMTGTEKVDNIL